MTIASAHEPDPIENLRHVRDDALVRGDSEAACKAAEMILSQNNRSSTSLIEQGVSFGRQDYHLLAARYFLEAKEVNPTDEKACWYSGLSYMYISDYTGWTESFIQAIRNCSLSDPTYWDGELECENLIVLAPGGIGDIIYNLRFLEFLRNKARSLSIAAPERVLPLIRHNRLFDNYIGLEQVSRLVIGKMDRVIKHEYLAGLAGDSLLAAGCFRQLHAPLQVIDYWQQLWNSSTDRTRMRVGLCWKGKDYSIHHSGRSFELEDFKAITEIAGVTLVSLQYMKDMSILESCTFANSFTALQSHVTECSDFINLSAQMSCLEAIVTCDTGIAHIAASLGKPTIVVCKQNPSGFWNNDKHKDLYPTSHVVKKGFNESWSRCIERAAVITAKILSQPRCR